MREEKEKKSDPLVNLGVMSDGVLGDVRCFFFQVKYSKTCYLRPLKLH